MRVGDLVRFKEHENEVDFKVGLLVRYDKFIKVAEIMEDDRLYYVPARLVEVYKRGLK
jgi:hypothetical protein